MRLSEELRHRVREDLGLLAPFSRGQDITIRNCWHFSTDGNFSSVLFQDETDFIDGMNRVCIVSMKHKVVILAFVLMDNHLHFILHGDLTECIIFMQDYIRRTSVAFHQRHGVSHIFKGVPVNHQAVTTDRYLKTAICYVFKNPPCAGTRFMGWNYPWGAACTSGWMKDGPLRKGFSTEADRGLGQMNMTKRVQGRNKPSPTQQAT